LSLEIHCAPAIPARSPNLNPPRQSARHIPPPSTSDDNFRILDCAALPSASSVLVPELPMARAPGSNDPVSYLLRPARFPVKFVLEDVWSVQCARSACHQSVHAGVLPFEQARFLPLFATMPTEVHKELPAAGATTLPTFCDPAVSCTAARRAGRAHAVCSVRFDAKAITRNLPAAILHATLLPYNSPYSPSRLVTLCLS